MTGHNQDRKRLIRVFDLRIFFSSSLRLRFNQVALNLTLINGTIALLRCQLDAVAGNVLRDIFEIFLIAFHHERLFLIAAHERRLKLA